MSTKTKPPVKPFTSGKLTDADIAKLRSEGRQLTAEVFQFEEVGDSIRGKVLGAGATIDQGVKEVENPATGEVEKVRDAIYTSMLECADGSLWRVMHTHQLAGILPDAEGKELVIRFDGKVKAGKGQVSRFTVIEVG